MKAFIVKDTVTGKYISKRSPGYSTPTLGKVPVLFTSQKDADEQNDMFTNSLTSHLDYSIKQVPEWEKHLKRDERKLAKAQGVLDTATNTGIKSLIKSADCDVKKAQRSVDSSKEQLKYARAQVTRAEKAALSNLETFEVNLP